MTSPELICLPPTPVPNFYCLLYLSKWQFALSVAQAKNIEGIFDCSFSHTSHMPSISTFQCISWIILSQDLQPLLSSVQAIISCLNYDISSPNGLPASLHKSAGVVLFNLISFSLRIKAKISAVFVEPWMIWPPIISLTPSPPPHFCVRLAGLLAAPESPSHIFLQAVLCLVPLLEMLIFYNSSWPTSSPFDFWSVVLFIEDFPGHLL